MKKFKDINFQPHPNGNPGVEGKCFFPNGYGISIVRFKDPTGQYYESKTRNENEWQLAVLKGKEWGYTLDFNTPIGDEELGYLTEQEVEAVMKEVQEFPNAD